MKMENFKFPQMLSKVGPISSKVHGASVTSSNLCFTLGNEATAFLCHGPFLVKSLLRFSNIHHSAFLRALTSSLGNATPKLSRPFWFLLQALHGFIQTTN